jgi:hypothetical protein
MPDPAWLQGRDIGGEFDEALRGLLVVHHSCLVEPARLAGGWCMRSVFLGQGTFQILHIGLAESFLLGIL